MICIDYYEARQRKNRANSWTDCHSRVEVFRQQAQKKICWDFGHARFNTSVWLQAGQFLALAAQIPAKQKSGCPRLVLALSTHISWRPPLRFDPRFWVVPVLPLVLGAPSAMPMAVANVEICRAPGLASQH
jgi:hypothetical protein